MVETLQEVSDSYALEMKSRIEKSKCTATENGKHHFMFLPHIEDFACIKCGKTMYGICYPKKEKNHE